MNRLGRYILYMLVGISCTLMLVFVLLNLPFNQRFVAAHANRVLANKEMPIRMDRLLKILPGSLSIQGITMVGPGGDTLVYAGELQARIRLVPLLRHRIILKEVELDAAQVILSRGKNAENINIAGAFPAENKKDVPDGERPSADWEISLRHGNFTNIRIQMNDSVSGIRILEHASEIVLKDFHLSFSDRDIHFRSLFLDQAQGTLQLMPGLMPPGQETGPPWNLGFQKLSMQDLEFEFSSAVDGMFLKTCIGRGDVRAKYFDLLSRTAHLNRVDLDGCVLEFRSGKTEASVGPGKDSIDGFQWDLMSDNMEVRNSEFHLGSAKASVVSELDLQLADFILKEDQAGLRLRKLAFKTDHGLSLRKMSGSLDAYRDLTQLQLDIRTDHSRIGLKLNAEESYDRVLFAPASLSRATLELEESHISLKDLAGFGPGLEESPFFDLLSATRIDLEGRLQMEDHLTQIMGISLSQQDRFSISLKGSLRDVFQFPSASGKVELQISGIRQDWLGDLAVASGVSLDLTGLRDLRIEGTVSDSLLSPDFHFTVESSLGNVDASGSLDLQKDFFSLAYSIRELALDELFVIPELGSLTGAGEIKGRGFSPEELMASYYLQVDSLGYKDYVYRNSQLTGKIEPGSYDLQLVSNDPALKADLQLELSHTDSSSILMASGILGAQLDELQLYADSLGIQTKLEGRLYRSGSLLESDLHCWDMSFVTPQKKARVKGLTALFETDGERSIFQADADFLHADFLMEKPAEELDSLGRDYREYFASFRNASHLTEENRVSVLPVIDAEASVSYHDLFDLFMGDSSLHFANLDASLGREAGQNTLHALIRGKDVSYKVLEAAWFSAAITDTAGFIKLEMLADSLSLLSGPELAFKLLANSSRQAMQAGFSVNNYRGLNLYQMELAGRVDSQRIVLEVPDQRLTLNGKDWLLEGSELLSIDLAENTVLPSLRMNHASSFLHLDARKEASRINYRMDLGQVELSSLLRNDMLPGSLEGRISGAIEYRTGEHSGKEIATELSMSDIRYSDRDYSDVQLKASYSAGMAQGDQIDLHARTDSLDVRVAGKRNQNGEEDLAGEFTRFPLTLIEPFTEQYISNLGGSLSGNFTMSSRTGREHFSGRLLFQDAKVKVNLLNNVFRIPEQSVEIADQKAVFKDFTIRDTLNKALKVDGKIDFRNLQSPMADLNITSTELQVMSRNEKSRAAFEGNVFINSSISIKGPLAGPDIAGKISLARGTEIYYHHQEDLRMTETEKLVNFVKESTAEAETESPPPLSGMGRIGSSSIGTVIEIDPSTRIHFNLARRMFDIYLDVQGGGNIQYNLVNEQMALSGSYKIREGNTYLKLVGWPNKSFRLIEGGYLRWDGMVDNPEIYLEAEHKVSTSYVNPIDNRNRDIDFFVILRLNGYLSDLNVEFTIRTPDQYVMSVINTQSPEEQMRQAISVLLFETIDLPGISSSTDYVTQQVNQILSSQLNQLTRSAIKGVDITLGLDTYDQASSGGGSETTTTLSYEVRKSFLNNRAQIEFSGRMKDVNQASSASEHSLNNLSFEYALDSAASKYLKVFNEHSYDDVFEGEVIKTGIGFSYKKRYRTFKDIWRRRE